MSSRWLAEAASRRQFLIRSGAWGALLLPSCLQAVQTRPRFSSNPFSLGVASGDPLPDGFLLWTRLAPEPLQGGGMENQPVTVEWVVADDDGMRRVVKRGRAVALPEFAHSIHVDVRGLRPDRWYFYQFKAGTEYSVVGRARTAPEPKSMPTRLRFAFASCQHYEHGYFTAYRHMMEEDLDLVVHLGDYIYEGAGRASLPRRHTGQETYSLSDYRNRYALYRSDKDLAKAHQMFSWIVTWDDHEVDNNYANDQSEDGTSREQFLERRANAYQAYWEHMPLRRSSMPQGSRLHLYRALGYGRLAQFAVLDTRQYRTDQPCGDGTKPLCPEVYDPQATLLGPQQYEWLTSILSSSSARWNIIAQQVMMAFVDRAPGPSVAASMDQWSGYDVERRRLMRFLGERRPSNPVVITGDIHSNWVCDLKEDYSRTGSPVVATEFVGTSITSGGDGADIPSAVAKYLPENPQVKFFNGQRGYVSCTVTPERWQADYRVLDYVRQPGSPVSTRASFVLENGRPGALPA
jgi:alkaline phosphatase D